MKEVKKNDISLALAFAKWHKKPIGTKKIYPVDKSERGPIDDIPFAEALTELHGKSVVTKKKEPKVQVGVMNHTLSKGGE